MSRASPGLYTRWVYDGSDASMYCAASNTAFTYGSVEPCGPRPRAGAGGGTAAAAAGAGLSIVAGLSVAAGWPGTGFAPAAGAAAAAGGGPPPRRGGFQNLSRLSNS